MSASEHDLYVLAGKVAAEMKHCHIGFLQALEKVGDYPLSRLREITLSRLSEPRSQSKSFRSERELSAAESQVGDLSAEAERLMNAFPDTREHIEVRRNEMQDILDDVKAAARQRHQKILQAQQLQAYFDDYRELIAWINEVMGTMASAKVARDVPGAEALVHQHKELRAEMDARDSSINKFIRSGREMVSKKHLLATEIHEKVDHLENAYTNLVIAWKERKVLYDMNLDAQLWKREASELDGWLTERERYLDDDWRAAKSVNAVDNLIRQYDDFLTTLNAQDEKFEGLKRLTLIEQAFSSQRAQEAQRKKQEEERMAQQRKEKIRTVEKQKILQERKQERERRRTQEIQLFKPNAESTPSSAAPTATQVMITKHIDLQSEPPAAAESLPRRGSGDDSDTLERRKPAPPPVAAKPILPPKSTPVAIPSSLIVSEPGPKLKSPSAEELSQKSGRLAGSEFANEGGRKEIRRGNSMIYPERSEPAAGSGFKKLSVKRTPSFTTRRPQSLKAVRKWDDMRNIEKDGFLERKQETQSGGKKAPIRSWKNYYTILCGQLLCFFKDEEAFMENSAGTSPVYILHSTCTPSPDYTKRKWVFKLITQDGAEYLFSAPTEQAMVDWVAKINFHAVLPPSMQLKHYEERDELDMDILGGRGQQPMAPSSAPPPVAAKPRILTYDTTPTRPYPGPPRMASTNDSGFMSPPPEDASSNLGAPPPPPRSQPPDFGMSSSYTQRPHGTFSPPVNGVNGHDHDSSFEDPQQRRPDQSDLRSHTLPDRVRETPPRSATPDSNKSGSLRRGDSNSPPDPNNPDSDFINWVHTHGHSQDLDSSSTGAPADGSEDGRKKKRGSRLGSFFKSRSSAKKE